MKNCHQCQSSFDFTPDDRTLLDTISPVIHGQKHPISEPTLCFDCRQQKKLAWRNERFMYKRKCDFSGAEIVSMYPPDSPFKVYRQESWWSDEWDALEYGRDFDFNRPFFEQFRELQLQVPRVALVNKQSQNSEFTNHSANNRNCYLSSVVFDSEDIYHSDWVIKHCKNCVDCSYLNEGSELCYEAYYAWSSHRALYSEFVKQCANVAFCYDCVNVQDSFMCSNLRNKKYCIRNQQYSKEDYGHEMAKIFPLSHSDALKYQEEYLRMKRDLAIHQAVVAVQTVQSSGDLLFSCKNAVNCFDLENSEDCRHCVDATGLKDSMNSYHVGWSELMYECHAISYAFNCLFCHFTYDNKHVMYGDCTQNCQNCFGCCGLNRKQYCILNKQYSKEEYEALVPKIIAHMKSTGEWGEFFPITFSPFGYNQSRAMEYYPLTQADAAKKGITWSNFQMPNPQVSRVIAAARLPEKIQDIPDDILNWAIECEVTKRPFKLVKQELDFYRTMGLPVPRRHPDQRYWDRLARRNPRKLWDRKCMKCGTAIQTSYSPDRPERVYCESCYLKEVY